MMTIITAGYMVILLIGLIMFILVVSAQNHVKTGCDNNDIRITLITMLSLSGATLAAGLTYFACRLYTNCGSAIQGGDNTSATFFGVTAFISVGMIVSSAICLDKMNKLHGSQEMLCGADKNNRGKLYVKVVLGLSSVIFVGCAVGIWWSTQKITRNMERAAEDSSDSAPSSSPAVVDPRDNGPTVGYEIAAGMNEDIPVPDWL